MYFVCKQGETDLLNVILKKQKQEADGRGKPILSWRVTQEEDTRQSCRSEATAGWQISSQEPRGSEHWGSTSLHPSAEVKEAENNSIPIIFPKPFLW